jgi:hypothetical protein
MVIYLMLAIEVRDNSIPTSEVSTASIEMVKNSPYSIYPETNQILSKTLLD